MKKSTPQAQLPNADECLNMARFCLSANLRKTERLITRHYDAYLEPSGVTAVQLPMLAMIRTAEEPTFRLLTEQLELDRSTLSRNLALLQRLGYIEIGAPSGPKPGPIKLTAKGRKVLSKAHTQWKLAHRDLLKMLDAEEFTDGLAFLKLLRGSARKASGKRAAAH
jgi:DNA-binding MarR family transcriptional regulator